MNIAQIKILAWEHWRRCLRTIMPGMVFFSIFLIGLIAYDIYYANRGYASHGEELCFAIIIVTALFNLLLLIGSNSSDSNYSSSMGKYYLQLPIKPWVLATIRIFLNAITLILCTLVFVLITIIASYFLEQPNSYFSSTAESYLEFILLYQCVILFIYFSIQVIAWSFKLHVVFILSVAYLYMLCYFVQHKFFLHLVPYEYLANISFKDIIIFGTAMMFPLSCILSGYSLRNARSDDANPVMLLLGTIFEKITAPFQPKSDVYSLAFTSPQEAQRWLEKHSMLQLYKNVFLLFILIFLLLLSGRIYAFNNHIDIINIIDFSIQSAAISIACTAILIGLCNGIIHYNRQTGSIKEFTYTKPISSRNIALSRMKAQMSLFRDPCLFLLGMAILYVFYIYFKATSPNLSEAEAIFYPASSLEWGKELLSFTGAILGFCIALWCAIWLFHSISVFAIFLTLMLSAMAGYMMFNNGMELDPENSGVIPICIFISILPVVGVWIYGIVKDLIAVPHKTLLLYPVVCFCIYLLMDGGLGKGHWDDEAFLMALFFVAIVYLPFASVPTMIHLTRHR